MAAVSLAYAASAVVRTAHAIIASFENDLVELDQQPSHHFTTFLSASYPSHTNPTLTQRQLMPSNGFTAQVVQVL
jgi:hypothetical protein